MEQFAGKQVKNHSSYFVSPDGEIYSTLTERLLNNKPHKHTGYIYVKLKHDGTGLFIRYCLHRVIAEMFLSNPDNLPVVNHKNLDKTDNSVENLEWVTFKENANHYHSFKNTTFK